MPRTAIPVYFITFCFEAFINMGGPASPRLTIENYASYIKSFSLVVRSSAADCMEKLVFKTCYLSTEMLQISC